MYVVTEVFFTNGRMLIVDGISLDYTADSEEYKRALEFEEAFRLCSSPTESVAIVEIAINKNQVLICKDPEHTWVRRFVHIPVESFSHAEAYER